MINLEKYKNEPEFQTALKEMFSSLDESVLNNPRYASILDKIVEPDRVALTTLGLSTDTVYLPLPEEISAEDPSIRLP